MNVLLTDDHTLFREGVALLLRPLVDDLQVWEAGSCEQALALIAERGAPDLVLLDLGLPGMSGLDGIVAIRAACPVTPVVALSSADDRDTVLRALDNGAMGFIPKSVDSAVFGAALKLVLAKGVYLPPSVLLPWTYPSAAPRSPAVTPLASSAERPLRPADLGLTDRQAQVLHQIVQGRSAKLICRELDLAPGTVKAHTSAVLRALNVTTRTQAVVAAGRLGLRFDGDAAVG